MARDRLALAILALAALPTVAAAYDDDSPYPSPTVPSVEAPRDLEVTPRLRTRVYVDQEWTQGAGLHNGPGSVDRARTTATFGVESRVADAWILGLGARFDYFIESDLEVGIVLTGSEVKSLRTGQSNIADSYASVEGGELWLINSYIAAYKEAGVFGHEERQRRKLLVSKRELARLWQAVGREGMTLVPLVMYFNHKGRVKLKIGVAKGKKVADKRQTEAKRDWNRQKQRLLKQGG